MLKLFDWFVIFIAIFVPPVSVYFKFGNKGWKKVAINFGLFVIGFIPALIHALYLISEDTLKSRAKKATKESLDTSESSLNGASINGASDRGLSRYRINNGNEPRPNSFSASEISLGQSINGSAQGSVYGSINTSDYGSMNISINDSMNVSPRQNILGPYTKGANRFTPRSELMKNSARDNGRG